MAIEPLNPNRFNWKLNTIDKSDSSKEYVLQNPLVGTEDQTRWYSLLPQESSVQIIAFRVPDWQRPHYLIADSHTSQEQATVIFDQSPRVTIEEPRPILSLTGYWNHTYPNSALRVDDLQIALKAVGEHITRSEIIMYVEVANYDDIVRAFFPFTDLRISVDGSTLIPPSDTSITNGIRIWPNYYTWGNMVFSVPRDMYAGELSEDQSRLRTDA